MLVKVDESMCNRRDRMPATQECSGEDCAGMWFTGPWGKVGIQARVFFLMECA